MKKQRDTQLLHIGSAPFDPADHIAPVGLPSIRTSTVRFANMAALEQTMAKRAMGERVTTYGISGMQTHRALEEVFLTLEGGSYCVLSSSGLASIHLALMSLLKAGDHILITDNVYGPVRVMNETIFKRLNIDVTFFSPARDRLNELIKPNTRLVYAESPGSLLMQMLDLPALAKEAKQLGLSVVVDNTWGCGIYEPLALGVDVSVVAGTKYINGHSDVLLGAIVTRREDLAQQIHQMQYAFGNSVSADDAWLALRGVKTLAVRLRQHAQNTQAVCQFLSQHPKVSRIYDPAWSQDPGHELWRRDCTGANGLIAVSLKCKPAQAQAFVDRLSLFGIGFSWGGYESLVQWVNPAVLKNHSYWQENDFALVRLHIGLEAVDDLIADLEQALECLP